MSKFFAEGNISDEDSDAGSNENENVGKHAPSYQYDFMDDDRNNNEKRVVRTEKEKKWNIVKDITIKINNALNNQDFEKVWNLLQDLLKEIEKMTKLIEKEGYPQVFLRCLKKIKDEIAEFDTNVEAKKKMKKHSATAFNTMKQKYKKIYPDFQAAIEQSLAKGDEDEDSEQQQQASEDSSSDEEDDKKLLESPDPMVRRKYWLKKPNRKETNEQLEEKEEDEKKKEEKEKEKEKKKPNEKNEKKITVAPKKKTVEQIQSIKDAESRMKQIRKNFMKLHNQEEREEYLLTLDKISHKFQHEQCKQFEKLSFFLLDLPIRIDVCRQMKLTHFPRNQWLKLYSTIIQINHILRESQEEDLVSNIRLFDEASQKEEATANVTEQAIYLSLKTYLILIEGELKKSLTYMDSNEPEYCERLQDLIGFVDLLYKISRYMETFEELEKDASQLAFKVLENTYFLSSTMIERIKQSLSTQPQFLQLVNPQVLEGYAALVLKRAKDEQTRIKTLLYIIYNHAINYREKGKELLVVSTLSQQILSQDYSTQCLYNRSLIQLGVGAFRNGNMFEVQQFLYEMCSAAKSKENTKDVLKEYLAQGYSRLLGEKQIPRSKILPAYLHLNVDLIESIELIAGMLLELPYMLTEGGRITSKTFKKFYYEYERNYFIEESLNNRDLIYSASLKLRSGDWQGSFDRLSQLNFWQTFPNADMALSNIKRTVKEQSLKCYLIGNRKCFKTISIKGLADKFDIEEKGIRKLICKLISEKMLQGSITREGFLVIAQKKQSEVQKVCETLANRLEEIGKTHEQWFSQKVNAGYDSQQEQVQDKDEKAFTRRLNLAINQKLKSILSKRTQKY